MREMFTVEAGDRPVAPNRALIITDVESDDPSETKRQAELAREQGTLQ